MPSSPTLRRAVVGATCAAALLALVTPSQPALAGPMKDPSGTQLLSNASSAYPDVPDLNAYTPAGIVYTDSRGVWLIPAAGGTPQPVAPLGSLVAAAAGKFIWIQPRVGTKYWYDVTTGNTGNVPGGWRAPSTTGGLYEQLTPDGTFHVMNQNVTTGRLTDLGALPSWSSTSDVLTPGPTGVMVVGRRRTGQLAMQFMGYSDPATTTPSLTGITGTDTVSCHTATAAAVGCVDTTSNAAIAISLTGLDPVIESTSQTIASGPVVTGSAMVWSAHTTGDDVLHSVPLVGGSETVMSTPRLGVGDDIVTDATNVYIPTSGNAAGDQGVIGSVTDATGTPSTIRIDDPLQLSVNSLAIGPGRAAWEDDATRNSPLWTRTSDSAGGSITLGQLTNVQSGVQNSGLFVSGIRTAYVAANGFPTITDGTTSVLAKAAGPLSAFSGLRLIYHRGTGTHPYLQDLVTGSNTDLTAYPMSLRVPVVLWGNYIAFMKADGSVWRADVTAGGGGTQIAPPQPTGRSIVYGSVWLSGTLMAWSLVTTDGTSYYTTNQYVDISSGTGPVNAPSGSSIIGASSSGVMLFANGVTTLQSWDGTSTMNIPGTDAVAEGDQVAWVGADGDPRIAPITFPVSDQPWALGPAVNTPSLANDGTWSMDLPTSAALANCSVSFSDSGGNVVDTTPCDSAAAAQGEVMVNWRPPASVPFGTYTWQLNASNASGRVLAANGSASPVTGKLIVGVTLTGQINPSTLARGSFGVTVVIKGNRFDSAATLSLGSGVRIRALVINSSTMMTATVDVPASIGAGPRTVTVSDPGSPDAVCRNCLTVT